MLNVTMSFFFRPKETVVKANEEIEKGMFLIKIEKRQSEIREEAKIKF